MAQLKKQKTKQTEEVEEIEVQEDKTTDDLKAESDSLLDEIDRLLEESTVASTYRQRGGE